MGIAVAIRMSADCGLPAAAHQPNTARARASRAARVIGERAAIANTAAESVPEAAACDRRRDRRSEIRLREQAKYSS